MADPVFRSRGVEHPDPGSAGRTAAPPPRRERLAIVVTGDALCGIAAYARTLERHLSGPFEITMIALDQYRLRGRGPHMRKIGDRHIAEICAALPHFDAVNLQFEYGTLGRRAKHVLRRFRMIAAAAPRLSVTFHSLQVPRHPDNGEFAKTLLSGRFEAAGRLWAEARRRAILSQRLPRILRRAQRRKPVSAIVHTPRNFRDATYLYGIEAVFDHPLAFLSAETAAAVRTAASRRGFPLLDPLPESAVLIGVFGFINHYKGFETVVRALHHLPKDYHLLIFGGVHPQEIGQHAAIHPYLRVLLDEAAVDRTLYERLGRNIPGGAPELMIDGSRGARELLDADPRDLSARIHFMGVLADDEFLAGMASCDAVVFPYLEVGQSASGPISLAVELGCRIIASRTHAFLGFAEYHPKAVEFFDIGNHLELAGRLRAGRQYPARAGLPEYNVETNKAVYLAANSPSAEPRMRQAPQLAVRSAAAQPAAPTLSAPPPTGRGRASAAPGAARVTAPRARERAAPAR